MALFFFAKITTGIMKGMLAQMGEHRSKQLAVAGSSPAHSYFFFAKFPIGIMNRERRDDYEKFRWISSYRYDCCIGI